MDITNVRDPSEIIIKTGNLLASESFKRKVLLIPAAELVEGIKLCLQQWTCDGCPRNKDTIGGDCSIAGNNKENGTSGDQVSPPLPLTIENSLFARTIDPDLRSGLKVSVKIFTYSESCSVFTAAVRNIMSSLGIEYIDSLTLSLPPARTKGMSIEEMKPIWSCAVKNVLNGRIKELGVSDLDTNQLKQLFTWAEDIKPTANQINLDSCCVIPPDMSSFASSNNIRLLTHNDPRDILPQDKVTSILTTAAATCPNVKEQIGKPDSFSTLWVGRYSVLTTGTGVIEAKGYIVSLIRRQ